MPDTKQAPTPERTPYCSRIADPHLYASSKRKLRAMREGYLQALADLVPVIAAARVSAEEHNCLELRAVLAAYDKARKG